MTMKPLPNRDPDIKFKTSPPDPKLVVENPPDFVPFFFVHIPKTGGISIITEIWSQVGEGNIRGYAQHDTASSMILRHGRERWNTLFSFAFTRNPYDRLLSLYYHFMQNDKDPRFNPNNMPFESWVKYVLIDKNLELMRFYFTIRPMTEWVYSLGELVVDYVGRFENMQESWDEIARSINLEPTKLPHVNASKHEKYVVEYEKSPELIDIVGKFYSEDLKVFGYRFGD